MKKTQKCFSGPKHGHFQQPEQQTEFLHLKRKTDMSITYQVIERDGQKLCTLPFTQHCIRPAQVDVNMMMCSKVFSSCRRFIFHKLPEDFEKHTAFP